MAHPMWIVAKEQLSASVASSGTQLKRAVDFFRRQGLAGASSSATSNFFG
jgi:hypothetical protein